MMTRGETPTRVSEFEQLAGKGSKENFRGNEPGYYPNRVVEPTERVNHLLHILDETIITDAGRINLHTKERLFDLVIYNAYGNVFPQVNSAGDFIGVIDEEKIDQSERDKYENSISLGIIKGKLAVAGGFVDVGEDPRTALSREAGEETGLTTISHFVPFAERSNPFRDDRFTVVSTCAAGIIDPAELIAGDDMGEVRVVPLLVRDKRTGVLDLNRRLFDAGKHLDINGVAFEHTGTRADHDSIITALFNYWETHGKSQGLSLSKTLREMSSQFAQEPFENVQKHAEGMDKYESLPVHEGKLLLTPNIRFALDHAEEIFAQAGDTDAETKAQEFVYKNVEAGVLPVFPQSAVSTDCIIIEGNDLVVAKYPDGTYRLSGGFYSPERDQQHAGASLAGFARETVATKFNSDFEPQMYAGSVGSQGDDRYPRVSHIFIGRLSNAYSPTAGESLPEGVEIVNIPLWADAERSRLSDEITQGRWEFGHSEHILQPVLGHLGTLFQDTDLSAQAILRGKRLV